MSGGVTGGPGSPLPRVIGGPRLITASARSWARKETPMQMTLILCFGGFEFVSRSGIGGVRLWHFPPSDVMSASCPRAYGVARPPAHPVWPGGCPRGDGLLTLGKRGGALAD